MLFLAAPGDEYEFLPLSEAEDAAGVQIEEDLRALLDSECLFCFIVQDVQPITPELNRRFSGTSLEHRESLRGIDTDAEGNGPARPGSYR